MKRADRLAALEAAQPKPVPVRVRVVSERARRALLNTLERREADGMLEARYAPMLAKLRLELSVNRGG